MAREKLYKNLTLQEKHILFFTDTANHFGMGCKEIESKTNKYRIVEGRHADADTPDSVPIPRFWLLGKSGGIRVNSKPTISDSRSMTESNVLRKRFLQWEAAYLQRLETVLRISKGGRP